VSNATPHTEASIADGGHGPRRWNILALYCYSHDGRRRDVTLVPGAVNIITGHSHTGKSALAELIDYVMGARDCNLPGRVFDASSWVAILWGNGETECFIARRVPDRRPRGTDDFAYRVGRSVEVPGSTEQLVRDVGRDQLLKRWESLLGIGDVETQVFGADRPTARLSFRNAMPFLLQDESHIYSRTALLRGMGTEQRQSLLDSLPYYVGVDDERTVSKRARLRALRADIAAADRRESERQAVRGEPGVMALTLHREAVDVGLAPPLPDGAGESAVHAALRAAAAAADETKETFASDTALAELYDRQRALGERGSYLRAQIEATRRALGDADEFRETADGQRQRLEVVNLLPDGDEGSCPLCVQPLTTRVESPAVVRRAIGRLREELTDVAKERPKLDSALADLEAERASIARELQNVRSNIADLVRAADERARLTRLSEQRLLVRGRISLYLQAAPAPTSIAFAADPLAALRAEADALADELDPETKRDQMDATRTRLGKVATEIAAGLPLEPAYVDQPIEVNLRTLTVSVVTERETESMRAIGSDENRQTLHVAVLLAFHRLFFERRRPVPGFVLFDQLSRPYYPPTDDEEAVMTGSEPEVASLRRYFDVLFAETNRGSGMQVLVLEHAYFSDDARYVASTRERWISGRRLIPDDWPDRA
jgi:hypothetical protein